MVQLRAGLVGAAASILSTLFLLTTAYARADEPAPQPFDIQPQSLSAALAEFARQSHEEILFAPEVVAQKRSGGVRGTMQPLVALKVLLKDSGIPFSSTPNGAILIGSAGGASSQFSATQASETSPQEGKKSASGEFRVAQVDQANAGPQTVGDDQSLEKKKQEGLTEIVVTGTHIRNAAPVGSPVYVHDSNEIKEKVARQHWRNLPPNCRKTLLRLIRLR